MRWCYDSLGMVPGAQPWGRLQVDTCGFFTGWGRVGQQQFGGALQVTPRLEPAESPCILTHRPMHTLRMTALEPTGFYWQPASGFVHVAPWYLCALVCSRKSLRLCLTVPLVEFPMEHSPAVDKCPRPLWGAVFVALALNFVHPPCGLDNFLILLLGVAASGTALSPTSRPGYGWV